MNHKMHAQGQRSVDVQFDNSTAPHPELANQRTIIHGVPKQDLSYETASLEAEGWIFDKEFSDVVGKAVNLRFSDGVNLSGTIIGALPSNFNEGREIYLWKDNFATVRPICVNHIDIQDTVITDQGMRDSLNDERGILATISQPLLKCVYGFLETEALQLSFNGCRIGVFCNAYDAATQLCCPVSKIFARLKQSDTGPHNSAVFEFLRTSWDEDISYCRMDNTVLTSLINSTNLPITRKSNLVLGLNGQKIMCLTNNNVIIASFKDMSDMMDQLHIPGHIVSKISHEIAKGIDYSYFGIKFSLKCIPELQSFLLPTVVLKAIVTRNVSPLIYTTIKIKDIRTSNHVALALDVGAVSCLSLDGVKLLTFPNMFYAQSVVPGLNLSLMLACCYGFLAHHKGFKWSKCDEKEKIPDFRLAPLFQNRCLYSYFATGLSLVDTMIEGVEDVPESIIHQLREDFRKLSDAPNYAQVSNRLQNEGWLVGQENEFMGLRVRRYFRSYGFSDATVVAYLPPDSNDGIPLWHLIHDDADEEDVEYLQLMRSIYNSKNVSPIFGSLSWRSSASYEINLSLHLPSAFETHSSLDITSEDFLLFCEFLSAEIPVRFASSFPVQLKCVLLLAYLFPYFTLWKTFICIADVLCLLEIFRLRSNATAAVPPLLIWQTLEYLVDIGACTKVVTGGCLLTDSRYFISPESYFRMRGLASNDKKSSIHIEGFRHRGGDGLSNLYFLTIEDAASALKLDYVGVRDVLYGFKQSISGFSFRLMQVNLNQDYFLLRDSLIAEVIQSVELKKNSKVKRSEDSDMLIVRRMPLRICRTSDNKKNDGEVEEPGIRVGLQFQAAIPALQEQYPLLVEVVQLPITLGDQPLSHGSIEYEEVLRSILNLGRMTYPQLGTVVQIKDKVFTASPACIVEDASMHIDVNEFRNLTVKKLQMLERKHRDTSLKVFDGFSVKSIQWNEILTIQPDDDVLDLIEQSSRNCTDIYMKLLDASVNKRNNQLTIDDIDALEKGMANHRSRYGQKIEPSNLCDNLQLMFSKAADFQSRRGMKDLVKFFCEFQYLFVSSESDYGGDSSDVKCGSSVDRFDRIQNMNRVLSCATFLRNSNKSIFGLDHAQVIDEAITTALKSYPIIQNVESTINIEAIQSPSELSKPDGTGKNSSKRQFVDPENSQQQTVKDSIPNSGEQQSKKRHKMTTDNVGSLQWMRKENGKIVLHENKEDISGKESVEERLSKLQGTPFPYHFVILESIPRNQDSANFDDVVTTTESKYGVGLFGRSHLKRSLERLATVGDLIMTDKESICKLRITDSGRERFSKKLTDYKTSGLYSHWGRVTEMIEKYCMVEMVNSILKIKKQATVKDMASIMLQIKNYPIELFEIEETCLLPMIKKIVSFLDANGSVVQSSEGQGIQYSLRDSTIV